MCTKKLWLGTLVAYPRRDGQAELTQVSGSVPRWFTHPKTVTHPGTNRARRTVTTLTYYTDIRIITDAGGYVAYTYFIFERYVHTLTYSILAYVYPRAMEQ